MLDPTRAGIGHLHLVGRDIAVMLMFYWKNGKRGKMWSLPTARPTQEVLVDLEIGSKMGKTYFVFDPKGNVLFNDDIKVTSPDPDTYRLSAPGIPGHMNLNRYVVVSGVNLYDAVTELMKKKEWEED
jgi:hypothetical protein